MEKKKSTEMPKITRGRLYPRGGGQTRGTRKPSKKIAGGAKENPRVMSGFKTAREERIGRGGRGKEVVEQQ